LEGLTVRKEATGRSISPMSLNWAEVQSQAEVQVQVQMQMQMQIHDV
jgi:hypothetical protein